MKYQSKSEAQQFADHLRGLILAGHFTALLPSIRVLSGTHGVSSVTVHAAFRILVDEGVLLPSVGTRRPRIAPRASVVSSKQGVLLIVNGCKVSKLPVSISASLADVEKSAKAWGFAFRRLDLPDDGLASVKRIRAEVRAHKVSHLLFVHPKKGHLSARPRQGVSCAFLPDAVHLPVRKAFLVEPPFISVPLLAFQKAKAAGHRHIALLDNVFSDRRRKAVLRLAGQLGMRITVIPAGSLGADNWIHHRPRIREVCAAIKASGATCVLFPQWADFQAAAAGLEKIGVEIPGQLSAIVAYRNGSIDSHHGLSVTGCDMPVDLAQSIIEHWLKGGASDAEFFADRVLETWEQGDTLVAPCC